MNTFDDHFVKASARLSLPRLTQYERELYQNLPLGEARQYVRQATGDTSFFVELLSLRPDVFHFDFVGHHALVKKVLSEQNWEIWDMLAANTIQTPTQIDPTKDKAPIVMVSDHGVWKELLPATIWQEKLEAFEGLLEHPQRPWSLSTMLEEVVRFFAKYPNPKQQDFRSEIIECLVKHTQATDEWEKWVKKSIGLGTHLAFVEMFEGWMNHPPLAPLWKAWVQSDPSLGERCPLLQRYVLQEVCQQDHARPNAPSKKM